MYHVLENVFIAIVNYGVLALEFTGMCIILYTAARSIWMMINRNPKIRLYLAQGIALALEFKLGGEVLRTAIARDLSELAIVGAIVLLRGAMTFLIHWEIKEEEVRLEHEEGHVHRVEHKVEITKREDETRLHNLLEK